MNAASKPWWQQATAVVSLGASGAITGFSFTQGAAHPAAHPSPAQIRLLALQQVAKPARSSDAMLRSAIVNVAQYYLRMAAAKTPAEMEALIWQHDSMDGADHGPSCAAFASLTLELGSHAIGQQSWVTGGTSYPWPLHGWADVRVDPNPASPAVVSVLQDAQAHDRWHPLGDGYKPQPGDWVLFNGHVEVVTKYSGGALHTIGGDSLPNFSVNAHEYPGPLSAQGITGFVNNGEKAAAPARHPGAAGHAAHGNRHAGRGAAAAGQAGAASDASMAAAVGAAAVPGTSTPMPAPSGTVPAHGGSSAPAGSPARAQRQSRGHWHAGHPRTSPRPARPVHAHAPGARPAAARAGASGGAEAGRAGHEDASAAAAASVPGAMPGAVRLGPPTEFQKAANGGAVIPGLPGPARHAHGRPAAPAAHGSPPERPTAPPTHGSPPASPTAPGTHGSPPVQAPSAQAQMTSAQRAFIADIAPGAVAAQHRYGVPASVTIAQAIDESGWGQSVLAAKDHNLFGMKGQGPAGTDTQLTQEYENGQWVVTAAPFRAYQNPAQSIDDHGKLLATSDYYRQVMADRHDPNAFAHALTGIYATDPSYGETLIGLMRQFNLYQYDHATPTAQASHAHAKPAHGKPAPAPRTSAPGQAGQASLPGLAQPPTGPAGAPGSGAVPGRGAGLGASSPPRATKPPTSPPRTTGPAPTSSPRTTGPAPTSPPRTTSPAPTSPPRTSQPAPTSPPRTSQPAPTSPPRTSGPAPSAPPGSARPAPGSPPNSAPSPSSRPSAARPAPVSPARRGRPAAAPPPHAARPAGGPRAGRTQPGGAAPRSSPAAPGTNQPGSSPGTSSIPGLTQPVPSAPKSAAGPAQPGGSARGGAPGRAGKAKPVTAKLVADWTPAPAGAGADGSAAPVSGASRAPAGIATDTSAGAAGMAADWAPADLVPDWTPADRVPDWAGEPGDPVASDSAGTGTGRARAATGLRERLAVVRPSRPAAAARRAAAAGAAGQAGRRPRYERPLPRAVRNAFAATARGPLLRAEPLYRDVAGHIGLPWELLAACDWMQCEAKPRHSPVHGEKLGTSNADGTVYWTKSAALEQCAEELVELAGAVYGIDLTAPGTRSVRDLANAFAAFRWGGLLKRHRTSAMEFPYSVAGLTVQHISMRWPTINEPSAPDKPGSRFRMHFGAVPVLLSLDYPATE